MKLPDLTLLVLTVLPGLLCSPPTLAAQSGRPGSPGVQQADKADDKFERGSTPPSNQHPAIDPVKLKQDADELAALAGSVPSEVDQTMKGLLPKDLTEKLKRIEKLAKQLRSQISR